jgi:hypothetical protein
MSDPKGKADHYRELAKECFDLADHTTDALTRTPSTDRVH